MKVDKKILNLISDLTNIIGSKNNTPENSSPYPLRHKTDLNSHIEKNFGYMEDKSCILTMYYNFGYNNLYIGSGIYDILRYIEERYSLDFNELEKKVCEDSLKDTIKEGCLELESNDISSYSTSYEAGYDIPTGPIKIHYYSIFENEDDVDFSIYGYHKDPEKYMPNPIRISVSHYIDNDIYEEYFLYLDKWMDKRMDKKYNKIPVAVEKINLEDIKDEEIFLVPLGESVELNLKPMDVVRVKDHIPEFRKVLAFF